MVPPVGDGVLTNVRSKQPEMKKRQQAQPHPWPSVRTTRPFSISHVKCSRVILMSKQFGISNTWHGKERAWRSPVPIQKCELQIGNFRPQAWPFSAVENKVGLFKIFSAEGLRLRPFVQHSAKY